MDWTAALSVSGWIIGALSFITTVYIYLKTRSLKIISCSHTVRASLNFGPSPDRPKVKFAHFDVGDRLTQVEVTVRNRGNTTIPAAEVREPLRVRFEPLSTKILGASLSAKHVKRNKTLRLVDAKDDIAVTWDYIDPGDQLSFSVFLDGPVSDVNFGGNFASGITVTKSSNSSSSVIENGVAALFVLWLLFGSALVGVLFGTQPSFRESTKRLGLNPDESWGVLVSSVAAAITAMLVLGALIALARLLGSTFTRVREGS
jgi:hypothetical protein